MSPEGQFLMSPDNCDVNGCWFSAQDYAGMGLEAAIRKAIFLGPGSLGTYGQGV